MVNSTVSASSDVQAFNIVIVLIHEFYFYKKAEKINKKNNNNTLKLQKNQF